MNYQKAYNSLSLQRAEKELQMYFAILNGQLIKLREEELTHPLRENDENIGGGRSNRFNSETENIAIRKIADDELNEYISIVDKVLNALQYLEPEELEVIEAYYSLDHYNRNGKRTIDEVQHITNKDKDYCEDVRQKALSMLKNGTVLCYN